MMANEFAYWLQGFFEITEANPDGTVKRLTAKQVTTIKNHLKLVFYHDLDRQEPGDPKKSQAIHDGHPPDTATGKGPFAGGGLPPLSGNNPGLVLRC